jgi:hypothetical protein
MDLAEKNISYKKHLQQSSQNDEHVAFESNCRGNKEM